MPDDHSRDDERVNGVDNGLSEIAPELEAELRELPAEVGHKVRSIVAQATFSGPIPHPSHLDKYESILPGSADRLISLAEKQSAHRQAIEMKLVDAEIDDHKAERTERRIGQWLGFGIGTFTVAAGAIVAGIGQPWAGGFIGTAGVAGLVSVFVLGRRYREKTSDD